MVQNDDVKIFQPIPENGMSTHMYTPLYIFLKGRCPRIRESELGGLTPAPALQMKMGNRRGAFLEI